jgi:uncharacterized protein YndB with AHSA1/START domain
MTTQATETGAIRKTVTVPLPVEKAFSLFTSGIDTWWPFESHSIGGDKTESAVFDVEAKRLYERDADGSEHDWADIVAWEPPNRFLLNWRVNPATQGTEVEVNFSSEGDATRVELEHRGWEHCGPGERSSYDGGWDFVLGKLVDAA